MENADLARLPNHIQSVNTDILRIGRTGDVEGLVRDFAFGVDLDIDLAGLASEQIDRDHLSTVFFFGGPALQTGFGRNIENPVICWDGGTQLGDLAAKDLIGEEGVGVDQAIFNTDLGVIRDTGEQVHLRFARGFRTPAGRDTGSRSEIRLDAGLLRRRFDGNTDEARCDFDGLVCFGDHDLEGRDPSCRDIEAEIAPLGRGMNPCREFDGDLLLASIAEQQRVVAFSGSFQQDLVAGFEFSDSRVTKPNRDFYPGSSQHIHGQFRANASQILFHGRDVAGTGNDRRDRGGSWRLLFSRFFEPFVLIQRNNDARSLAFKNSLEELEGEVNLVWATRLVSGGPRGLGRSWGRRCCRSRLTRGLRRFSRGGRCFLARERERLTHK